MDESDRPVASAGIRREHRSQDEIEDFMFKRQKRGSIPREVELYRVDDEDRVNFIPGRSSGYSDPRGPRDGYGAQGAADSRSDAPASILHRLHLPSSLTITAAGAGGSSSGSSGGSRPSSKDGVTSSAYLTSRSDNTTEDILTVTKRLSQQQYGQGNHHHNHPHERGGSHHTPSHDRHNVVVRPMSPQDAMTLRYT